MTEVIEREELKLNSPTVTVVTVVYNGLAYIKRTLESVIEQHFDNYEYVVVDGGSNDGTQEVIEGFLDDIDVFVSEPDEGLYHAMNKAVSLSKGEYIIYMHCGDRFFDSEALGKLATHAGQYDLIYGRTKNYIEIDGEVKVSDRKLKPLSQIHYGSVFCHQSALVSKEYLSRFPFATHYRNADYEHIYKTLHYGAKTHFVDAYINYFQIGGISSFVSASDCYECWKNIRSLLPLSGHFYFLFRIIIKIPIKLAMRRFFTSARYFNMLYNRADSDRNSKAYVE